MKKQLQVEIDKEIAKGNSVAVGSGLTDILEKGVQGVLDWAPKK
jgi:hypothetical protein